MAESVLTISNIGFPPLSLRGCHQELIPLQNGEMKKTINGNLVYIKRSDAQKYKTIIRCCDTNSPALGNLCIGNTVVISCIQNIWQRYDSANEEIILSRPPANDSVMVIDKAGKQLRYKLDETEVQVLDKCDEEIFVAFRPCLTAIITDFKTETDEWNLSTNWTITATEV